MAPCVPPMSLPFSCFPPTVDGRPLCGAPPIDGLAHCCSKEGSSLFRRFDSPDAALVPGAAPCVACGPEGGRASCANYSTGPLICDLPGWIVTWCPTRKEGCYFARLIDYPDMMVVPSLLPGQLRGAGQGLIGLAVSLDGDVICKKAFRLRLRDPRSPGVIPLLPVYVRTTGNL